MCRPPSRGAMRMHALVGRSRERATLTGEGEGTIVQAGDSRPDVELADLEALRDAFVEAFNARDLDLIAEIVDADVEVPDLPGHGLDALRDELERLWLGSPGIILTRAVLDGSPVAVSWMPDDEGGWWRSGLYTFDEDGGVLVVVEMPDDPALLDEALADTPEDEPPDEEVSWPEWDRAEDVRDVVDPLRPVDDDEF